MENGSDAMGLETFETVLDAVQSLGWSCQVDRSLLKIRCYPQNPKVSGATNIKIDCENSVVSMRRSLPFEVPESMRLEVAIILNCLNFYLDYGTFEYRVDTDRLFIRIENSFRGLKLSCGAFAELLNYMELCAKAYGKDLEKLIRGEVTVRELVIGYTQ